MLHRRRHAPPSRTPPRASWLLGTFLIVARLRSVPKHLPCLDEVGLVSDLLDCRRPFDKRKAQPQSHEGSLLHLRRKRRLWIARCLKDVQNQKRAAARRSVEPVRRVDLTWRR